MKVDQGLYVWSARYFVAEAGSLVYFPCLAYPLWVYIWERSVLRKLKHESAGVVCLGMKKGWCIGDCTSVPRRLLALLLVCSSSSEGNLVQCSVDGTVRVVGQ